MKCIKFITIHKFQKLKLPVLGGFVKKKKMGIFGFFLRFAQGEEMLG